MGLDMQTLLSWAQIYFLYLAIRNLYVYHIRQHILKKSGFDFNTGEFIQYERLPSYIAMLFSFRINYSYVFNEDLWD